MSEWKMVPRKIGYRERLAFEVVIGRALSAEEGQRLWDAMLATGPDQWQPIETAPKDGSELLLTDGFRVAVARWDPESWPDADQRHSCWSLYDWHNEPIHFRGGYAATHWMASPEPPPQERRGGLSRAPEAS